ncbi:MAG: hypothetical protein IGS38_21435 [Synechococcales cyanobacterium M58_A2018_015]|nr:hypothetical protein [Synechococcales cyanobacterium M58_A2018_015]
MAKFAPPIDRTSRSSVEAHLNFRAVAEPDAFLALFPHRFDYIYAPHPEPGHRPQWQTESRHPLSDRLIQQGQYLFGVRFGPKTKYCLLDIDIHSAYHPQQDPLAIARIVAALEPLGLVTYVGCTSSYSQGLHLYFPFAHAQSSWELALAVATLLDNAGFKRLPGQLEVFPNPKPYTVEGKPSLFNAHRLPLQTGSYLVNQDFQPVWSSPQIFQQQWQQASARNDLNPSTLKQIVKQAKRCCYRISGKADKFINDLNAEIEPGWTGPGQTNYLLGRITMRAYIFHHLIEGGPPLTGQALVNQIVQTARSLPGYYDWCRHTHEIEQRAEEWARCIEQSHYFHYGTTQGKYKTKLVLTPELEPAATHLPSWNQQQAASARERIKYAIADLLEKGCLPSQTTARFKRLTEYGIGGGSLYRHRDLWHPDHLAPSETQADGANSTSLFSSPGGNPAPNTVFNDRLLAPEDTAGGNGLVLESLTTVLPTVELSMPIVQPQTAVSGACETDVTSLVAAQVDPTCLEVESVIVESVIVESVTVQSTTEAAQRFGQTVWITQQAVDTPPLRCWVTWAGICGLIAFISGSALDDFYRTMRDSVPWRN